MANEPSFNLKLAISFLLPLIILLLFTACNSTNEPAKGPSFQTSFGEEKSCNHCHGNAENFAPPSAVARPNGELNPFGVGAHQAHLKSTIANIECSECHVIPDSTEHAFRETDPYGKITFGPLATANGATPVWDRTTGKCGSVYCHGSTLASSSGFNPAWNDTYQETTQALVAAKNIVLKLQKQSDTEAKNCTLCHGDLAIIESFSNSEKTFHK